MYLALARRPVTLRDRERPVLQLARDDLGLLRLRRATARLRDLAPDGGDLRRAPDDRDLARLAFLAATERTVLFLIAIAIVTTDTMSSTQAIRMQHAWTRPPSSIDFGAM